MVFAGLRSPKFFYPLKQVFIMKIIDPSHQILNAQDYGAMLRQIERAGRICYKSETKISKDSAIGFVKRLIDSGHHSVIEHSLITVKFICDRGISHEIMRHRLASFSQESTRYANYSKKKFGKEITVIRPYFWQEGSEEYAIWLKMMQEAEKNYMRLLQLGAKAEQARSVLPNSLKTEMVVSCNIREWRHILNLRCSKAAHPQMRQIMNPLLDELNSKYSIFFNDIYSKFSSE
jgi:thymidylate synthase (FAD)